MDKEIWKYIIGFEGRYSVSSFGRILNNIKNKEIKRCPNPSGYLRFNLWINGKNKCTFVHQVVASSFLGKCPKKHEVNHKDCNKKNNYLSNLEYVTRRENARHAVANGRFPNQKGILNKNSKLCIKDIFNIRKEYSEGNTTHRKLAKKYNVTHTNIGDIIRRKRWSHIQ